jgi:hypothetical protein
MSRRLRRGDRVEVRPAAEILATLDADGTLDGLPFMPEMIEACGGIFRVASHVFKTCMSGSGPSTMRQLRSAEVFTLESVRCSGAAHDGCQKGCLVFWRSEWLRSTAGAASSLSHAPSSGPLLRGLKTTAGPNRYFCQASELTGYTRPLSRHGRIATCVRDLAAGNVSVLNLAGRLATWGYWAARRRLRGEYAAGTRVAATPTATLALQSGERVTVRPVDEIRTTTNQAAYNRGLYFSPDMAKLSAAPCRVLRRADKIIVDGTGEMRSLKNTVFLEGSYCGCAHVAFGGCPRQEFAYWREIWLDRTDSAQPRSQIV